MHASVFIVHGINDQNVTTNQFGEWWPLLAARTSAPQDLAEPGRPRRPVRLPPRRVGAHPAPWFDYWLQGLHNGIMDQPQASIERADGPGHPVEMAGARHPRRCRSRSRRWAARRRAPSPTRPACARRAPWPRRPAVAGRAVFLSGALHPEPLSRRRFAVGDRAGQGRPADHGVSARSWSITASSGGSTTNRPGKASAP